MTILVFRAVSIVTTKTPFVLLFVGLILLMPKGRERFLKLFNIRSIKFVFLIPLCVVLIGSLQVLRWASFDFSEYSFSDVLSGYATTFDQLDTLNFYLDLYAIKYFNDFGYWIGDLYLIIPRFLWEDKPTNYGSRLITEYMYPNVFYISEDGTGGGQFPNGLLVQALDFFSVFGFPLYAAVCGVLVKAIDKGLQDNRWHVFAASFFMLISMNSLVRSGLVEYMLYGGTYLLSFFAVTWLYMSISARLLSSIKSIFQYNK
jgi:hypothetical protein